MTTTTQLAAGTESMAERAYQVLRDRLIMMDIAPGDPINEAGLVDDLGVGRTPLREALKVLAAEGLVTMKLRRGAYVTEMSQKDLLQVYHLLALLESDAAAELARAASDAQIAELQALHQALEAGVVAVLGDGMNRPWGGPGGLPPVEAVVGAQHHRVLHPIGGVLAVRHPVAASGKRARGRDRLRPGGQGARTGRVRLQKGRVPEKGAQDPRARAQARRAARS